MTPRKVQEGLGEYLGSSSLLLVLAAVLTFIPAKSPSHP